MRELANVTCFLFLNLNSSFTLEVWLFFEFSVRKVSCNSVVWALPYRTPADGRKKYPRHYNGTFASSSTLCNLYWTSTHLLMLLSTPVSPRPSHPPTPCVNAQFRLLDNRSLSTDETSLNQSAHQWLCEIIWECWGKKFRVCLKLLTLSLSRSN